jgi:hypothetical protein
MDKKIQTDLSIAPMLDRQGDAYPELVASLQGERATGADMLLANAHMLLEQNGVDSTVNGLRARVTEDYALVVLGGKDYRARVAQVGEQQKRGRKSAQSRQTLIVFDEDEDVAVRTASPFAITFRDFAGDTDLVVANNMDPLVGDDRYAKLVQDILANIGQKALERQASTPSRWQELQDKLASRRSIGKVLDDYFRSRQAITHNSFFDTVGERRRFVRGVFGVVALMYAHVPFMNSDAEIASVPMPLPVEVIVDLANRPDHKATGFSEPIGATQLVIGEEPVRMALLPDYNTSDAPDTTYSDFNKIPRYNESKRGLYALTVPETDTFYDSETEEYVPLINPATGCYDIRANTSGGRTLVFTQSPHLVDQVTVQAVSAESIEVCPVEYVKLDQLVEGKIYFFQRSSD